MVEAGMPAMESLQSATTISAKLLRADDSLGKIKAGFMADIIAVNADPTQDINTMIEVAFVMKNGLIYKNE
jgi:imidazolonepropionase-like amidohydrolase